MEGAQLAEFERNVRLTYKRFYDFGAGRLPALLANLVNDGEPPARRC